MLTFPSELPCALQTSGSFARNTSSIRHEAFKGRPRQRASDRRPSTITTAVFDFDAADLALFYSFWASIGKGVDWFWMETYAFGNPTTLLHHATAPFSIQGKANARYSVSLPLEIIVDQPEPI